MSKRQEAHLDETEEDIGTQRPLVSFVNDHTRVTSQIRFGQEFPQKHTIRHVFDLSLVTRAILESNGISNLPSQSTSYFFSYTSGDRHGSDSTRLSTSNLLAVFTVTGLHEVLRELSRLARSSFSFDDEDLIVCDCFEELLAPGENG